MLLYWKGGQLVMFDFERLYVWKKRRFLRSPGSVFLVLPKELDLGTILEYYVDNAGAFPRGFLSYVEWMGGREATAEDLISFELEEVLPKEKREESAAVRWKKRDIDTSEIGHRPGVGPNGELPPLINQEDYL